MNRPIHPATTTKRERELYRKWVRREMTLSEVSRKIKKNQPGQAYSMLARASQDIYEGYE